MTWLDVFIILPAVLPKFKMCTLLAWSGFANLSFAASQWPEHLIEPMRNYLGRDLIIWLRHSAIIVFTWHRVPASLWDLNQNPVLALTNRACCILYVLAAPHISTCNFRCWQNAIQIGHLTPIGGLFADIVRNRSGPFWTILTLLLMTSSEPFRTVLNYIDAKKWNSSK